VSVVILQHEHEFCVIPVNAVSPGNRTPEILGAVTRADQAWIDRTEFGDRTSDIQCEPACAGVDVHLVDELLVGQWGVLRDCSFHRLHQSLTVGSKSCPDASHARFIQYRPFRAAFVRGSVPGARAPGYTLTSLWDCGSG